MCLPRACCTIASVALDDTVHVLYAGCMRKGARKGARKERGTVSLACAPS